MGWERNFVNCIFKSEFSHSSRHQNPLHPWFTTQISGLLPRVSDTGGLDWGLRVSVSSKFPGDAVAAAAGPGAKPWEPLFSIKQSEWLPDLSRHPNTSRSKTPAHSTQTFAPNLGFYSSFTVRVISCYWEKHTQFRLRFVVVVCFATRWKFLQNLWASLLYYKKQNNKSSLSSSLWGSKHKTCEDAW